MSGEGTDRSSDFLAAISFQAYADAAVKNRELWNALYRTATVPEGSVERAGRLEGHWHLLALSEDWCGDAVNTLPIIAKFAEAAPNLDLRVASRDANPDLTMAHLTAGTRSIPVVMTLDHQFREWAWWGPRPADLQRWLRSEGFLLGKEDRYPRTRRWYARDRGRTTILEVLDTLERAARRARAVESG